MPTYRIIFFKAHRLNRWEQFEAGGHLEAVELAAKKASKGYFELWSDSGRIAVFRPAGFKPWN